ncbi:MAG TPA: arylamine N-acetyltransferase [Dehalococcoidia bacterium]|nr:arylamine N-acetyltransferase [Dehalococcoidia bacterium]
MDVRAYLQRIGYDGPVEPTIETLREMHRAHFYRVPFENLDIRRGVRIQIDPRVNFDKVVGAPRGGFCLELTGLFATALRAMGFRVDVIGARVMSEGRLSEPMSHMTLIVHLDEPWIADVGFGGRVAEPLRLGDRDVQRAGIRGYVVANDGDHWFVTCTEPDSPPMTYLFTMQPREFEEFAPVCDWLQTSPDSRFTQGDVVSLATPEGRLTFAGGRLIVSAGGARQELAVASTADERAVLRDRFGIALP